jgi:ATP-dependent Clp protease ATP-binding subunit ClpC
MAEMLLRGDLTTGSTLKVGVKGEELKFDVVKG